jgi:hypothetical protein
MRKLMCALVFLLARVEFEGTERGAAQSTTSSETANRIVAELIAAPFGTSRKDWRETNPAAKWREFKGDTFFQGNLEPLYLWPEAMWCVLAVDNPLGSNGKRCFTPFGRTNLSIVASSN